MATVLDFRSAWLQSCPLEEYDKNRFLWEQLKRINQAKLEAFGKDKKNEKRK